MNIARLLVYGSAIAAMIVVSVGADIIYGLEEQESYE